VRIGVDPGGLTSSTATFGSISQEVAGANAAVAPALSSAEAAAGDALLSEALGELAGALETAISSASLTLSGLSRAVALAAQNYSGTEANISRAARLP
jgi:hypothetical protein